VVECFRPQFDLPAGWVAGWIAYGGESKGHNIFIGISPKGESHS